jgi:hypothetical protein
MYAGVAAASGCRFSGFTRVASRVAWRDAVSERASKGGFCGDLNAASADLRIEYEQSSRFQQGSVGVCRVVLAAVGSLHRYIKGLVRNRGQQESRLMETSSPKE